MRQWGNEAMSQRGHPDFKNVSCCHVMRDCFLLFSCSPCFSFSLVIHSDSFHAASILPLFCLASGNAAVIWGEEGK